MWYSGKDFAEDAIIYIENEYKTFLLKDLMSNQLIMLAAYASLGKLPPKGNMLIHVYHTST